MIGENSSTTQPRYLPMTNPFSGTAFPSDYHGINGIWSVDQFLAHMPDSESTACREVTQHRGRGELRVFRYATGTNATPLSIKVKMESFLLRVNYEHVSDYFIQFWAPMTSRSGRSRLTVLEQPFGMGRLDHRFCRYRYGCMKKKILVEGNIAGPIGRVFTRGSPEYAEKVDSYSKKEFPMRGYAKFSGSYLALPIFESGTQKKCVGVLEFFSMKGRSLLYGAILMRLKDSGLSCTRSHSKDCPQVNHKSLISLYGDVLNLLMAEHDLPLIQMWMPCFCDETSSVSQLFCRWTSRGSFRTRANYVKDRSGLANGWYSVENGKGLVGRAYSQKKSCFLPDAGQLSISECPLAHFTRSCVLTACFAIPVQSFDPKLHDFILEVFLPFRRNWDHGDAGAFLQSLLSSLFQNRAPQYYTGSIPSELEQNEEICVKYSHSDSENFVYFDASHNRQTVSAGKALGNGGEEHHFLPMQEEDNDQNSVIHVAPLNRVESFNESLANGDAECVGGSALNHSFYKRKEPHNFGSTIRLQNTQFVEAGGEVIPEPQIGTCPRKKARENEAPDANFIPESAKGKGISAGNDEINRGNRIIVKANYNGDVAKFFFWSNSGIEELHGELHKRFKSEVEEFKMKYKDADGRWIVLSCHEDLLSLGNFENPRTDSIGTLSYASQLLIVGLISS